MKLKNVKGKLLYLGHSNPRYQYRLEEEHIEISLAEKDLGCEYWWMENWT